MYAHVWIHMYAHEYICFFTKYEYFMYFLVSRFFTPFFVSSGLVHILGFVGSMIHPVTITLLSVSALEDAGYSTLFRRGHVYIFPDRDDLGHVYIYLERARLIDPQLIGDRFGELYKFGGHPTIYDSESKEEQGVIEAAVAPRFLTRL